MGFFINTIAKHLNIIVVNYYARHTKMVKGNNMQTVYKSKHKIVAELMAHLTNSGISKDEKGNLTLISKSEMDEKIAQFLEKDDFIGAGELLEGAKKMSTEYISDGAEFVSKSIRSPFITYLKYHEVSQKENISLSDVIRIKSIPAMKNKLDDFKDMPSVDQEKLRVVYDLLENWKDKKPTSPNKEYDLGYYTMTDDNKYLFEKFLKFSIYNKCKEYDFPIELMKEYLNSNSYTYWGNAYLEFFLGFDTQSNSFELSVFLFGNSFILQRYQEFKENIDPALHAKFDDILNFDIDNYIEGGDALNHDISGISGKLHIENGKLLFDGAQVDMRKDINAVIYEKITNDKYIDSEIAENKKQLQEALARNEYDNAAALNEKPAKFQLFSKVAGFYGDIISKAIDETRVMTFTLPKFLLMLWEATKGDQSIPEFLESNIREV
jgi:ribosomal protein S8